MLGKITVVCKNLMELKKSEIFILQESTGEDSKEKKRPLENLSDSDSNAKSPRTEFQLNGVITITEYDSCLGDSDDDLAHSDEGRNSEDNSGTVLTNDGPRNS